MDQSYKLPNTLIIIFGVPGSGKSWASKDIRKRLPSQSYLIEADKIEQLVNCGVEISLDLLKDTSLVKESTSFSQEAWKKSRTIVFDAVKQFLTEETNLTILLDDDFLLHSQRKDYFHLCCDIGVNYVEVLMNTELDVILQRNAKRVGNKQIPENVLRNFYQKLERKPINKGMFVLSDDLDLKHIELASQKTKEFIDQKIKNPKQLDSVLHQFDCQLRQVIGLIMKSHDVGSFKAGIREFFNGSPDETFMNEVEQIWQMRKDPIVLHKMKKEYLGMMGQQEIKQLSQKFIISYYNLL